MKGVFFVFSYLDFKSTINPVYSHCRKYAEKIKMKNSSKKEVDSSQKFIDL
jgi:hypothetical protein